MKPFTSNLDRAYDVADQMRADLMRRASEQFAQSRQEKAELQSVAAFEARRERVRANFFDAIGGLPAEKTPLNARVTGVTERPHCNIERTIFESLPEYYVSAACYVPHNLQEPAPAVLFFCGHSGNGKAHDTYQAVCNDLARNGFIVLAIDPIGQGERLQYLTDGEKFLSSCTVEHTHAGFPFLLMGASVARHFVWDGIRAFDYLASRPDVDASRIGATGNSGGGTQTMYMMLAEPRLAAAVPCTFPTTLEAMQKSGQAQDMEQIVAKAMLRGPDHDDFFTALAPKPVQAGIVAYDFFPIEGSREMVRRAQQIYELYGCPENAQMALDNSPHCYSDGLRQASVNWFRRHLQNRAGDFVTAGKEVRPDTEVQATRSGQVLCDFPTARTITDLTVDYLDALPAPETAASLEVRRQQLAHALGVASAGDRSAPISPRIVPGERDGVHFEKIWFFSGPDIAVSGVLCHPPQAGDRVLPTTILLLENGTNGIEEEPRLQTLLEAGQRVFVFDVRGVGGVAARSFCTQENRSTDSPFHSEYRLACDAMMAGTSTLGLRAFDVLRALDYLQTRDDVGEVSLHGVGAAATWAFFAAALEAQFAAVTCEEMLVSYRALCRERFYDHTRFDLRIMAWGLLRCGDIVDFLPLIAPRPLKFIKPLDPLGNVLDEPPFGD